MYDSGFIILGSLISDPGDRLSHSSLLQGEDQERIIGYITLSCIKVPTQILDNHQKDISETIPSELL